MCHCCSALIVARVVEHRIMHSTVEEKVKIMWKVCRRRIDDVLDEAVEHQIGVYYISLYMTLCLCVVVYECYLSVCLLLM